MPAENNQPSRAYYATPATRKPRHIAAQLLFLLIVVVPVVLLSAYMFMRADDRYHSELSFSVRSEEIRNPLDMLSGLGQISGSSNTDAEILHEFIGSQRIVELLSPVLNLRQMFAGSGRDPVFSLPPDASLEALRRYWRRQVHVSFDKSSGVVRIESVAFSPRDAQRINEEILRVSQDLVDDLSRIARADATRFTEEQLDVAARRLRVARQNFSVYRVENQIIDPEVEIRSQSGALGELRSQLTEALLQRTLLDATTGSDDPRVTQADRRIAALREQIEKERGQIRDGDATGLAKLVGDYESLALEREFAEKAYVAAAAAHDSALSEADRRSKYLAVHIQPTLADTPIYPQRITIILVSAVLLMLSYSIAMMVFYSLRDRR